MDDFQADALFSQFWNWKISIAVCGAKWKGTTHSTATLYYSVIIKNKMWQEVEGVKQHEAHVVA